MRFLFVEKISEIKLDSIKGIRTFADDAPMQYALSDDDRIIAPGVISEAIGQLASWLCLRNNDFTGRAVFLFADKINIFSHVRPGAIVELTADLQQMDEETLCFSGEAFVDGELVQSIENCNGYFMPLSDLEDPEVCRQRYNSLIHEGLPLPGDVGQFDFASLIDESYVLDGNPEIDATKTMREDERFYGDHFPRFPVTPIVVINEMIGVAAQKLIAPNGSIVPKCVEAIKIRNFVKPTDTCDIKVKILEREPSDTAGSELVKTVAMISKAGKPILRGRYTYEVAVVE